MLTGVWLGEIYLFSRELFVVSSVSAQNLDEAKGLWDCAQKKVPVPGEEERGVGERVKKERRTEHFRLCKNKSFGE